MLLSVPGSHCVPPLSWRAVRGRWSEILIELIIYYVTSTRKASFLFQLRRSCWLSAASTPAWSTPATRGRPSFTTGPWLASPTASAWGATKTTTAARATYSVRLVTTTSGTTAVGLRGPACAWTAGWARTAQQVSRWQKMNCKGLLLFHVVDCAEQI